MRTISITQALVELKTLDRRIRKAENHEFVFAAKNTDKDSEAIKELRKRAKASYQSARDLMRERENIKAAIVSSNAKTKVTIAGEQMTVAEAIEKKTSIDYEQMLLSSLKAQLASIDHHVTAHNKSVDEKIDRLLETLVGADKEASAEEQKATADLYRERNGIYKEDPIGIQDEIDALEKYIADFLAEVDVALSISNAKTMIKL